MWQYHTPWDPKTIKNEGLMPSKCGFVPLTPKHWRKRGVPMAWTWISYDFLTVSAKFPTSSPKASTNSLKVVSTHKGRVLLGRKFPKRTDQRASFWGIFQFTIFGDSDTWMSGWKSGSMVSKWAISAQTLIIPTSSTSLFNYVPRL